MDYRSLLSENSFTVSTAESCTGGNIAHEITRESGSSEYFIGSVVSYSNQVKEDVLGVSNHALMEFGAVSEIVAKEMADGARRVMQTDYAISTTGIAGPTGGSNEKPVGTVWIGIASESVVYALKHVFSGDRVAVINQATEKALELLLKELKKDLKKSK